MWSCLSPYWLLTSPGATPSYFRLPRLLISLCFIYPIISDSSNRLEYVVVTTTGFSSRFYEIGYYNEITHSIGLAILWSMIILYIVSVTTQDRLARPVVHLFNSARVSQECTCII
jgi:hypothetical protein